MNASATRLAARGLYLLAAIAGRLPWAVQDALADLVAWLWRRLDARESRVAWRNLQIAYPEWSEPRRRECHRAILRTSARQFFETMRLWTQSSARNLALIGEQHGTELFDAALARGKGLIVAAPHYGNWELLSLWLARRTPIAVLYRPPASAVGEAFLNLARADDGGQVTQVRAQGAAIRELYSRLKGGGVVGILPDQGPRGDGEFAPFFGKQALTMTLLGRLASKTGATVLYAYCERINATGRPEFALRVEPAAEAIASDDIAEGVAALNAGVERIARRDPAQYQWTYKRYTARPDGSGEPNPYSTGST